MVRTRVTCSKCGADVEALTHCGVCGVALRGSSPAASTRPPRRLGWLRARPSGWAPVTVALGSIVILAALLADAPGIALAVAAVVSSLLIVIRLTRIDVFEREPVRFWYLTGAAAFVAGVAVAIADAFVIERFWFSGATFHAGAAGFAGEIANGEAAPPIIVLALGGIVLPLAGLGLMFVVPLLLRRFAPLRNEVMDGIILGASAGGGFAAATTIVYFWPLIVGERADTGVADGTAMILGVVLVRPMLFALIAGLAGAGVWRSMLTERTSDLVVPTASALTGLFAYSVIDRVLMPFGSVVELGWVVLVAAGLGVIGRRELRRAVRHDRQQLVAAGGRTVCPHCRSVTPAGDYCAACGKTLRPADTRPPANPVDGAAVVREADVGTPGLKEAGPSVNH